MKCLSVQNARYHLKISKGSLIGILNNDSNETLNHSAARSRRDKSAPLVRLGHVVRMRRKMTKEDIKRVLETEVTTISSFENFHGITQDNLRKFLVDPYQVLVLPDDGGETETRHMWVVLQEFKDPEKGYLIAYDPLTRQWELIEKLQEKGEYLDVLGADTLADALTSM